MLHILCEKQLPIDHCAIQPKGCYYIAGWLPAYVYHVDDVKRLVQSGWIPDADTRILLGKNLPSCLEYAYSAPSAMHDYRLYEKDALLAFLDGMPPKEANAMQSLPIVTDGEGNYWQKIDSTEGSSLYAPCEKAEVAKTVKIAGYRNQQWFQGEAAILAISECGKKLIVAECRRFGKGVIHYPELVKRSGFKEFNDGFYFRHPSGSPDIVNKGATEISL